MNLVSDCICSQYASDAMIGIICSCCNCVRPEMLKLESCS